MRAAVGWVVLILIVALTASPAAHSQETPMQSPTASPAPSVGVSPAWAIDSATKMERELVARYGEPQRERIERGLQQVAEFWRAEDGDAAAFEDFVRANFAGDQS